MTESDRQLIEELENVPHNGTGDDAVRTRLLAAARLRELTQFPKVKDGDTIPWQEEFRGIDDTMLFDSVGGAAVRCGCGCNVFKRVETDVFRCNSCGAAIAARRNQEDAR